MLALLVTALFWQEPARTDVNYAKAVYLWHDKVCHGTYCDPPYIVGEFEFEKQEFYLLIDKKWSKAPSDPPVPVPEKYKHPLPGPTPDPAPGPKQPKIPGPHNPLYRPNFGLDPPADFRPGNDTPLRDDSAAYRLSSFGVELKLPSDLASRVVYVSYTADSWITKRMGVECPAVVLQDAKGTIIYVSEASADINYADILSALSPRTPDSPEPPLAPEPEADSPPYAWIVVGVVALLLLRSKL